MERKALPAPKWAPLLALAIGGIELAPASTFSVFCVAGTTFSSGGAAIFTLRLLTHYAIAAHPFLLPARAQLP